MMYGLPWKNRDEAQYAFEAYNAAHPKMKPMTMGCKACHFKVKAWLDKQKAK